MEATNQIKIELDKIAHYMNEVGKVRVFLFIKTSPLFVQLRDFVIARQVVSLSSSLVLGGLVEGLLEWKRSRVRQWRQWLDYIRASTGLSCALRYVK